MTTTAMGAALLRVEDELHKGSCLSQEWAVSWRVHWRREIVTCSHLQESLLHVAALQVPAPAQIICMNAFLPSQDTALFSLEGVMGLEVESFGQRLSNSVTLKYCSIAEQRSFEGLFSNMNTVTGVLLGLIYNQGKNLTSMMLCRNMLTGSLRSCLGLLSRR